MGDFPLPCFNMVTLYPQRGGGRLRSSPDPLSPSLRRSVPCGGCLGCRASAQQGWRTRIVHESKLHASSMFVTFTYADEHLPVSRSLSKVEAQLVLKRLRWEYPERLRFFLCGEYGAKFRRPHYHAVIFNLALDDMRPWRKSTAGGLYYRSAFLEKVWPYGHVECAPLTPDLAGYVAGYCVKKLNGEMRAASLRRVDDVTGEVWDVAPEFITMSKKPGLGHGWYERFSGDAFPSDFVIVDGERVPVPRYYKLKLDKAGASAGVLVDHKRLRQAAAPERVWNNTADRLAVRREVAELRAQRYAECGGDEQ